MNCINSVNSIPELIADLQQGRMVIMQDDLDRENEGDLIMAACSVSAQDINFMARFGRGLICVPMTESRREALGFPWMPKSVNRSPYSCRFTVSIEAASGVTTGISAADRARTIQCCVDPQATHEDFIYPGHIFPIVAETGGVLQRRGHTEAVCDLLILAGLPAVGVLVEILNEDGTMARTADLQIFAQTHGLKRGTIADVVVYRQMCSEMECGTGMTAVGCV
jgi:3,4-dihydroxy 2-butanone 4-phosphate synthase/GTP cyclohydrolase II